MDYFVIGIDIGGTSIKSGIIDANLNLSKNSITVDPAKAEQDAESIIDNITAIIIRQLKKVDLNSGMIQGVGFAFPGPFDYENGISFMRNIGKYDAIYGLELPILLRNSLAKLPNMPFAPNYPIIFENDAVLFSLGEYYKGKAAGSERAFGITLGTGCGSAFLNRGRIIKGIHGVPENGAIYNQPFRDSIVDDYISRRGILKLADRRGFDVKTQDVKELAQLAREGNVMAIEVFNEFGRMLSKAIEPYLSTFNPDVIVLGGQISNAFDLFGNEVRQRLLPFYPDIQVSENSSESALVGAAWQVFTQIGLKMMDSIKL